jgi:hypothetical protein
VEEGGGGEGVQASQYSARGRDVEEERDSRSIGLPIFGSCIGEYSEEVEMWRKRRDVVQASQYSAAGWRIL